MARQARLGPGGPPAVGHRRGVMRQRQRIAMARQTLLGRVAPLVSAHLNYQQLELTGSAGIPGA